MPRNVLYDLLMASPERPQRAGFSIDLAKMASGDDLLACLDSSIPDRRFNEHGSVIWDHEYGDPFGHCYIYFESSCMRFVISVFRELRGIPVRGSGFVFGQDIQARLHARRTSVQ